MSHIGKVEHPVIYLSQYGIGYGFGPAPGYSFLAGTGARVRGKVFIEDPYDSSNNLKPGYTPNPGSGSTDKRVED